MPGTLHALRRNERNKIFDPEEKEEDVASQAEGEGGEASFFRASAVSKKKKVDKLKKIVTQFSSDGEVNIENMGKTRSQTKKSKKYIV